MSELQRLLNRARALSGDASALEGLLIDALASDLIGRIVRSAAVDEESVRHIAARSYSHRNGFRKCLLDDGDVFGPALRIHSWSALSAAEETSDIHNHAWNFASFVLRGKLMASEYQEDDMGQDYFAQQVGGLRAPGILDRGTQRLAKVHPNTHVLRDHYPWPRHLLHGPEAADEGTITLVLQGAHLSDHTFVYSRQPLSSRRTYSIDRLNAAQVRDDLGTIAALLP